jgi:hypothetical protein
MEIWVEGGFGLNSLRKDKDNDIKGDKNILE